MSEKTERKSWKELMKGSLDSIKTTADSIKSTAKNIKVSDIKMPEMKMPELKIPPVKNLIKKKESDETQQKEVIENTLQISSISTRNALKIIYYLMAIDGHLAPEEEEKFDILGKELSPDFSGLKEIVIYECQNQLKKVIDPEDVYDVLQDGVEDALITSVKTEDTFITPKLLVWDLLTLAYSDNNYNDAERRLLKYVVRKTNVDKAVFLEMESTIQTLIDLEKEQQWIKTTDRPYLTIESMVNEIEDRKQVVYQSIKDLIAF